MPDLRLIVIDPAGLHARPAARFVQAASRFTSRITIRHDGREADAKSLIALLGLTIRPSSEIIAQRRRTRRRRSAPCARGANSRPTSRAANPPPDPAHTEEEVSIVPDLFAEAHRRGDRHRDPRIHRRGQRPAHGAPDRLQPVRQRRALDDLVRLRLRDLRGRLLGRPHQWLPHQPAVTIALLATRKIDTHDGRRLHRRPAGRCVHRRRLHADHPAPATIPWPSASARWMSTPMPASAIGFAAEVIGTAILVFTVFGAAVDGRAPGRVRRDHHRLHRLRDHHPCRPDHRRRPQPGPPDRPGDPRG